jgi:tRNA (Thr-GGU) A37 N-methylase
MEFIMRPISISVVRLISARENFLEIKEVDVMDGKPLMDIKPYIPDFDIRFKMRTSWYEARSRL